MTEYTPEHQRGSSSYDCLDCAHDDGNGDCTLRPRPFMQASWATVNGPCRKWQKRTPEPAAAIVTELAGADVGNVGMQQCDEDLFDLNADLVGYVEEPQRPGYVHPSAVVIAKRRAPVFPDAPYVVWYWNPETKFGSGRYDLTYERAVQVLAERLS